MSYLDDILLGISEGCGVINYDITESKQQIINLVKQVIGEKSSLTKYMSKSPTADRREMRNYSTMYSNAENKLREEQLEKLKQLFGEE